MDQATTRAAGATPRAVGEFQGYVDGADGIKPSVRWLDRKNMPQVGDKLFAIPARAAVPRTWSLLLTSENHGQIGKLGCDFSWAPGKHERVQVMEIVEAGAAPAPGVDLAGLVRLDVADILPGSVGASTVLTDERIENLWHEACLKHLDLDDSAIPDFARAIEREVAAQAGQVAVPDEWPTSDMVDAGGAAVRRGYSGSWRNDRKPDEMLCSYIFRHMLAAAQPEGEAPQADVQAPSAAAMDDVVDNLREYADNAGYSHNDYQDTMRQAANTIEALRAQLWHWGPLAAQQAAAPGAPALLNAEEMAALHRFQETCQDFDSGGYDVDKNMMKRLAAIGVIESKGFNRYQFTEFGDYVVEHYAPSAPGTPEAPALNEAIELLGEVIGPKAGAWYTLEKRVEQFLFKFERARRSAKRAAQLDGGQGEEGPDA